MKFVIRSLVAAAALALFGGWAQAQAPVKIGIVISMTGPAATLAFEAGVTSGRITGSPKISSVTTTGLFNAAFP